MRHAAGLARALRIADGIDPQAGREFARVTRAVLGDAARQDAWTGGLLNQSGCPLEFSFGPAAAGLRYTMEVGPPGAAPAARLGIAATLLETLGAAADRDGAVQKFAALQLGQPLAWGAWLAARQSFGPDQGQATHYKVYAEIPDGPHEAVDALLLRYLDSARLADAPWARPVMAGAVPGSSRCEIYFELGSRTLTLASLRGLLGHVGLAHQLDALAALVHGFEFRRGRTADALPRAHYGFSYATLPARGDPVFSLHVFAHDLSGGDAWIRGQALAAARHGGDGMPGYAAITAPLAGRDTHAAFHNMLTFSVGAGQPPAWLLSVCPPPDPITDP